MNAPRALRMEIFALLASATLLLLVLYLHLLPSLIAGLLVFSLVNTLTPLFRTRMLWGEGPRLVAVTLIAGAVIALIVLLAVLTSSLLRESNESIPALINSMAEIIEDSREQMPVWISDYMPTDAEELRRALVEWLRENASVFQVAGTDLGRLLAHVLIGMVVGGLLSLETAATRSQGGPLSDAIGRRALRLNNAFRRVVFAQIWISAINTALTALYLVVVLPLFGIHLPFTKTLIVLTFVVGLLPIIGNLTSNTVIFIVSLSDSFTVAMGSLAYLIIIHKLEYFLNARIIGSRIQAKAWEILLALLVLEAAFGIPGLIAAPIYYAYLKDELRETGLLSPIEDLEKGS